MSREHLGTLQSLKQFAVVGIYSRSSDRARVLALEYNIDFVASSISELYATTGADIALVCVPEMSTEEVCFEIYKYPWVSLIEKPVGYTPQISKRISHEATRLNRTSFVALNRRFYGSTLQLEELASLNEGRRFLRIIDQENTEAAINANQPREVVRNWMYANSIHIIDYAQLLMRGHIVSKEIKLTELQDDARIVSAHLVYDSGDETNYTGLWNTPGSWAVNVNIGKIEIELRPLEKLAYRNLGDRNFVFPPVDQDDVEFKPGLKKMWLEIDNFFNTTSSRLVSVVESQQLMQLIQLIYEDD